MQIIAVSLSCKVYCLLLIVLTILFALSMSIIFDDISLRRTKNNVDLPDITLVMF